MNKIIIGLGYRARSGKDTVGNYLVEHHGFHRIAFADQLKYMVGTIYKVDAFDPDFKTATLPNGKTGGQTLQDFGVALRAVDPDVWIAMSGFRGWASIPGQRIVVTDVRFPNEAAVIKQYGGELWEIKRHGLPRDLHPSETGGLDIKWDHILSNTYTLDYLYTQVDDLLLGLGIEISHPHTHPMLP